MVGANENMVIAKPRYCAALIDNTLARFGSGTKLSVNAKPHMVSVATVSP